MDWYYAQSGQQKGPVTDVELAGLVVGNIVTDQTLVWHAGLANWQPYGEVKAGAAIPADAAPPVVQAPSGPQPQAGQILCAECGRIFPQEQAVAFGSAWVCAGCKSVYVQKLKEGVVAARTGPMQTEFAGFWLRFAAKLIDGLALGLVLGVPMFILLFSRMQGMSSRTAEAPFEFLGFQLMFQFVFIAGAVAYNTFFIGKYAATLGKMAVGIKVIVADGSPPTYLRAFGRAWAEQLSGLICDIGYIIAAFDDEKRALHDHICNTRVVRK